MNRVPAALSPIVLDEVLRHRWRLFHAGNLIDLGIGDAQRKPVSALLHQTGDIEQLPLHPDHTGCPAVHSDFCDIPDPADIE